jgi:hypothetical protein
MSTSPSIHEAQAAAKPGVFVISLPAETLKAMSSKIPDGVNVLVVPPTSIVPEFIRLPKPPEVCGVTGLPRSTLMDLLKEAGDKVQVRSLRKKGAVSGPVVIVRQSLIDYINSLPRPDWEVEES